MQSFIYRWFPCISGVLYLTKRSSIGIKMNHCWPGWNLRGPHPRWWAKRFLLLWFLWCSVWSCSHSCFVCAPIRRGKRISCPLGEKISVRIHHLFGIIFADWLFFYALHFNFGGLMFFSLHTFEQKAGKSIQDFNGQWGWIRCFFLMPPI